MRSGGGGRRASRRALLVLVAIVVAIGLFVIAVQGAIRLGWLEERGPPPERRALPPPHFRELRNEQGNGLLDAKGRALWSVDPSSARSVGVAGKDRRWLTKEKDPGSLRILSIGESTTAGIGYDGSASYSRYLEARLRRRLGRDAIEVVNCGVSGYDSHDWPTLAEELAGFAPDLLVIYVGHNELKKPNLIGVRDRFHARLQRSRLLRTLFGAPKDDLPDPPAIRVGSYLQPDQREFALGLFEDGLRALLDFARERRVRVVLCLPASNVLDQPPRLSILRPGPDAARRQEEVAIAGRDYDVGVLPELSGSGADPALHAAAEQALARVERALVADPDAAILHYRRGRILLALGRADDARGAFSRALEVDGLPERASPDIVARTRTLAREYGVSVADVEARLARESARTVPGFDLFYDYCHPILWGHWLIADEILRVIESGELLAPAPAFDGAREAGDPGRARFDACNRELGISEAGAARTQIEKAKLQIGAIGTRPEPDPRQWTIPEEFLKAAERQDPVLAGASAEFRVLRAFVAAGSGRSEPARAELVSAERLDAPGVLELARRSSALPGLVSAMRGVGITLDANGFHWEGHP